jgi:hypothetical protein
VVAASRLIQRICKLLDQQRAGWALVGGWAVSVRTEPRFTRDVAVAVGSDYDAEQLISVLTHAQFQIETLIEQTAVGRLATVRLASPDDFPPGLLLDILFASSGIEPEICQTAERVEMFPGVVVPVARLEYLLATKILARDDENRPQDRQDIRMLLRAMDDQQVAITRQLLDSITTRGFNRGKDLQAELNAFAVN